LALALAREFKVYFEIVLADSVRKSTECLKMVVIHSKAGKQFLRYYDVYWSNAKKHGMITVDRSRWQHPKQNLTIALNFGRAIV